MPRNPELNEQMRSESRSKIISTAASLFSHKGYFNVRISDIASQAQMSPGNIYWYFSSKEELLKAILQDFFDAYEGMLVQAEELPGDGLQKIKHLIDLQINLASKYGMHFNIYMSILGHGGSALLKTLGFITLEIGMRFHNHMANILERAIQEGLIQAQEPQTLAMFFFSFFNGLLITYGADWQHLPPQVIAQATLRLLGYCGDITKE